MDRKELGNKVRSVREHKHLTQQNMADGLGMKSAKQYGRYESGESKQDIKLLERIAGIFKMTLVELLAYDEAVSFDHCKLSHAPVLSGSYPEISDNERVQYEARIKHLEEAVAFLREANKALLVRLEGK